MEKGIVRSATTKKTSVVKFEYNETIEEADYYFAMEKLMIQEVDKKTKIDAAIYSGDGDLAILQSEYKKIKDDLDRIKSEIQIRRHP